MAQLLDAYGRPMPAAPRQAIRARWDAAAATSESANHWANADTLAPNAAASREVRAKLRQRSRYEALENDAYLRGIVLCWANSLIGTGPTLRVTTANQRFNDALETAWSNWSHACRLAGKLRLMTLTKKVQGEAIAIKISNPRLRNLVKLDVSLVEPDQMTTPPWVELLDETIVDGIQFDSLGNPVAYFFLPRHPGETGSFLNSTSEPDRLPARSVIHWFRPDRPGQARGVPETAASLQISAQRRRWRLAVMAAAETAASLAGILYTDAPPDGETDEVEPLDQIPLNMRTLLTAPAGWKVSQMKAEHPDATHESFNGSLLTEAARPLLVPRNEATGDSSSYNFASGRLDRHAKLEAIEIERDEVEAVILDDLLRDFLAEASMIRRADGRPLLRIPAGTDLDELPHDWRWDPAREIDPEKEYAAKSAKWANGHLTDEQILTEMNVDPEAHYRALQRQNERRAELGLPLPGSTQPAEPNTEPASGTDAATDQPASGTDAATED